MQINDTDREALRAAIRAAYKHGFSRGHAVAESKEPRFQPEIAADAYMEQLPAPTAALIAAPREGREVTRCARCVGEIGRVRVTGRRGGVFCSESCADQSDYDAGVAPDELESGPPPSELAGRLEANTGSIDHLEKSGATASLAAIARQQAEMLRIVAASHEQPPPAPADAALTDAITLALSRASFYTEAFTDDAALAAAVEDVTEPLRALRSVAEGDAEPVAWLVDCYVDGKWYDRYVRFEPPTVKQIKSDDYRITPLRAPARHGESAPPARYPENP